MSAYLKASIKRSYAEGFLSELERNENQYFFFIARSAPWTDENSPPAPGTTNYPDSDANEYEVMRGVVGYKKLDPSGILFALPRYSWTSGTVYDQYDDTVSLFDASDPQIFYVVTDENNIYKCLRRATGTRSTIKPYGTSTVAVTLSDGYVWKYMATVRASDLPYELSDYIPVDYITSSSDTESTNQYNVQSTAVVGALTRLDFITNGGASAAVYSATQYSDNTNALLMAQTASGYTVSSAGVKTVTLDINSKLTNPSSAVGYVLQIASSTASQTQNNYALITAAANVSNLTVFTVVDDATVFSPVNSTQTKFNIIPRIRIRGDGVGAYAFPTLNATKNITGINLINGGQNYTQASVSVTTSISTQPTKIHPSFTAVTSPKGGHGNNILKELGVQDLIIIIRVDQEDISKLRAGGSYRQFGIIKNPILNDPSGAVAGSDKPYYKDITFAYEGTNTSRSIADWKLNGLPGGSNNFIVGTESGVGSTVYDLKSVNPTSLVVKAKIAGGNYVTQQDRPNDFILTMQNTTEAGNYALGEDLIQTVSAGSVDAVTGISYGYDLTAKGYLISKNDTKLIVRSTQNSFVVGTTLSGVISGATGNPSNVAPLLGEYAWIYDPITNQFVNENGNRYLFKVTQMGSPYFDLNETPAYTGLTCLVLGTSVNTATGGIDTTSAALTPNSFSNGDFIQQGISASETGNYASGTVYSWEFTNASTGRLFVTNTFGSFQSVAKNGIAGSTLGAYIVTNVISPDIVPNSGEVIYINNIRSISRIIGQSEEFRLRLGF